jgi:hypothetical protein
MKFFLKSRLIAFYLSVPFITLYIVVRSLPVEPCDFLHEETYNLEGEVDYCGPGDNGFIDLSLRKWPMSLDFRPLDSLEIGKPCRFEMNIKQADGSPLTDKDVALSHTRKIHLLAVDPSLDDYQHLHPDPDPLFKGIWRFTLTPRKAGKYKVYLDLIPIRSPRRVLLATSFEVAGDADSPQLENTPQVVTENNRIFRMELLQVEQSGTDTLFQFSAQDSKGNDLPLMPVMGAFAHVVAFEPSLNGFAHLHPLEYEPPQSQSYSRYGPLTFSFKSGTSVQYRFWAQIRVGDDQEESFVPFDINI